MRWLQRLAPYALASALLFGLKQSPAVEPFNLLLFDLGSSLRTRPSPQLANDIAVVAIGETDIDRYNWPIPDSYLCKAIRRLDALDVKAIGLDLYRDQTSNSPDQCLNRLVVDNPRLISIFNNAESIPAIPGTPDQQQAFNDVVVDADRVVRRDLVHVGGQGKRTRSLPLRLLETARNNHNLGAQLEKLPSSTWLEEESGGYKQQDAAGYQTMLDVYPPGRYPVVGLEDLLQGRYEPDQLRGRIILIGSTAASLKDQFEIPDSRWHQGDRFLELPGVELHAQRLESLQHLLSLNHAQIRVASALQRQLLLAAMVLLGIAIAERPSRIRRSALLLALGVGGLLGAVILLLIYGFWIGAAMPLAGLMLFGSTGIVRRGAISQHHQQEIRRLLGQATSPAVAQQLWNQRAELIQDGRFTGREQAVTILFSDTCNFTQVSEQLSPAKLMEWLNQGMAISVDAVTSHGGMVNKFTGDGMLAVFGAPVSAGSGRDASQALAAARSIQTGILNLNQTLKKQGSAALRLRVGIHSGVVLTGSLGSRERLEYAVIGDTVNCASRLESLDKERHQGVVRVLVSSTTLVLAGENLEQPSLNDWGEITVTGRKEPLRVFELGHVASIKGRPPAAPQANGS